MSQDLKISLLQCNQLWENKSANLKVFEKMLAYVEKDTDIIIFPEMFQTGFSMRPEKIAEPMQGETMQWLRLQSQKYQAAMIASLAIVEHDKFHNRLIFMLPDGQIYTYDKRKLFSYSNEDHHYHLGDKELIVQYKNWKIAFQICYDLRFPECARNSVKNEEFAYDLLVNVANWPHKRSWHWKILLRAKAIENQAYVVGVNRVGEGAKKLLYSGDSSIISASGEILQETAYLSCVINETLSFKKLSQIRKELPFLKDGSD